MYLPIDNFCEMIAEQSPTRSCGMPQEFAKQTPSQGGLLKLSAVREFPLLGALNLSAAREFPLLGALNLSAVQELPLL